jgi:hypothetical protein
LTSAMARARRAVQRETAVANMCSGTYVPPRMERDRPEVVWLRQAKNGRPFCKGPCRGPQTRGRARRRRDRAVRVRRRAPRARR